MEKLWLAARWHKMFVGAQCPVLSLSGVPPLVASEFCHPSLWSRGAQFVCEASQLHPFCHQATPKQIEASARPTSWHVMAASGPDPVTMSCAAHLLASRAARGALSIAKTPSPSLISLHNYASRKPYLVNKHVWWRRMGESCTMESAMPHEVNKPQAKVRFDAPGTCWASNCAYQRPWKKEPPRHPIDSTCLGNSSNSRVPEASLSSKIQVCSKAWTTWQSDMFERHMWHYVYLSIYLYNFPYLYMQRIFWLFKGARCWDTSQPRQPEKWPMPELSCNPIPIHQTRWKVVDCSNGLSNWNSA